MHRIDGDGAINERFVGRTTSQEGTVVTADWLNAIQEEIANVVEAAPGVTLEKSNNAQLLAALQTIGLGSSSGIGSEILRVSLAGSVQASSTRVLSVLAGMTGNITRIGGRISGAGTATVEVKADGSTVATFSVDTTNGSDNIAAGDNLEHTGVSELSLISIYVTDADAGAMDLALFVNIDPPE
jgi:hypothetical protein